MTKKNHLQTIHILKIGMASFIQEQKKVSLDNKISGIIRVLCIKIQNNKKKKKQDTYTVKGPFDNRKILT